MNLSSLFFSLTIVGALGAAWAAEGPEVHVLPPQEPQPHQPREVPIVLVPVQQFQPAQQQARPVGGPMGQRGIPSANGFLQWISQMAPPSNGTRDGQNSSRSFSNSSSVTYWSSYDPNSNRPVAVDQTDKVVQGDNANEVPPEIPMIGVLGIQINGQRLAQTMPDGSQPTGAQQPQQPRQVYYQQPGGAGARNTMPPVMGNYQGAESIPFSNMAGPNNAFQGPMGGMFGGQPQMGFGQPQMGGPFGQMPFGGNFWG